MAHEWYAGVLNASSWHGLEVVRDMKTAQELIAAGEESGAYPVAISLEKMRTDSGLYVPGNAVVAKYLDGKRKAMSSVGSKYTPLNPQEWRDTIAAAVKAGARPAGAFALREGTRLLATFEIEGGNGGTKIANYLNMVDSLDGSLTFSVGGTSVRTVCANTLQASFSQDGAGYARLKHTASINDKSAYIRDAITKYVESGNSIAKLYREAKKAELNRNEIDEIFNKLFPEAEKGDSQTLSTRKSNKRLEAAKAMALPVNNEGNTVATVWNAATWLIDRELDGKARKARGDADPLDSLLFGARNKRVQEIRKVIEVVLRDGTTAEMEVSEARAHGIDDAQIARASGKSLLEEMLED